MTLADAYARVTELLEPGYTEDVNVVFAPNLVIRFVTEDDLHLIWLEGDNLTLRANIRTKIAAQ